MNILITGGVRGLGRELGDYLSEKGNNIIVIDLESDDNLDADFRRKYKYYRFDLNNYEGINSLLETVINDYGNIDVLINNASLRNFKYFSEYNDTEIINYVNVNMKSIFLITYYALKRMIENNFGRIINISSVSAYKGYSTGSLYCSLKSSLLTFNESVSRELNVKEKNVTLNTICPDSFMKISGEKLKNYDRIVNKVIQKVIYIIASKVNGKIFNVFSLKSKIKYLFVYFIKSFSFLR